jgi:hypothetical protein
MGFDLAHASSYNDHLRKVGQMKIEVKEGVLARKLGKDFKDEGFIPLEPGTYEASGPAEQGYLSVIVSPDVTGHIHVDKLEELVKQNLVVIS